MIRARQPIISLTTDFGSCDPYVGIVKGVILGICPRATLVDITHGVPPQDVNTAALVLRQAAPFFPPQTIHLAVVDPGVGTARRAVAASTPLGTFVAPDNGILTGVVPEIATGVRAVNLNRPEFWLPTPRATFHARDILGPVAAYLAAGASLMDVGSVIPPESLARLPWPKPVTVPGAIVGEIIEADHFGDLVSNISLDLLNRYTVKSIHLGDTEVGPMVQTYGDSLPGQPAAYVGSAGFLEIAVVNGSAAQRFRAGKGTPVRVSTLSSPAT